MGKSLKKAMRNLMIFIIFVGLAFSSVLPVQATQPLGENDNVFRVKMYSATAGGEFEGTFFKKDNALYVSGDTLMNMVQMNRFTDGEGMVVSFARIDAPDIKFMVSDENCFVFDGVSYYSFMDAVCSLCINVEYDYERELVRVLTAKNVWDITASLEQIYNNKTYNMFYWQNAKFLDADISRIEAQITDIGRHLYALPASVYSYMSGDADMESYRGALWKIMVPMIDVDSTELTCFNEEMKFIQGIEGGEYIGDALKDKSGFWGMFGETWEGAGKITGVLGDLNTLMQVEDSLEVIKFYYSIENMDASIVNGVKLIGVTGMSENSELEEAFDTTLDIVNNQEPLPVKIAEEAGDGVVELLFGSIENGMNSSVAEFGVNVVDNLGEKIFPIWFLDYNAKHVDGVIEATSNLHIQDAAKRSYHYYKSLYEATENIQKKSDALQNMKDVTLIYLLAGHNAWKAFEFDEDLAVSSAASVEEIIEHISYLLSYDLTDFEVYERALDAKHAIMAKYAGRARTYYFFQWDEAKGKEVGGLTFSIEGKDLAGQGFLYKKLFSHLYYQQNGILVGNIRYNAKTDAYSRIVGTYSVEGVSEIVIRPGQSGQSVADVGMNVAVGFPSNVWKDGLEDYLVTEPDGSVIYRIPLPLGSGVSEGEALPTKRVESKFDFVQATDTTGQTNADNQIDYVPTGPFNGEFLSDTREILYRLKYNDEMFYVYSYSDPYSMHVAYASQKDVSLVDNIGGIRYVTLSFEEDYTSHKNRRSGGPFDTYEKYDTEDYKEITIADRIVRYYRIDYRYSGSEKDSYIYQFYVDLGTGFNLSGWWGLGEDIVPEGAETIEKFLLEMLSNIEIEYKK